MSTDADVEGHDGGVSPQQTGPVSAPARGPGAPAVGDRPLGISLLTWLYWFWVGAIVLVFLGLAVGDGPVPISGETVPRSEALERVLPVLLPMGLAVLGAAMALGLRKAWARPAILLPVALAAFGPALSGVGVTTMDVVLGAVVVLPILGALVWYLYYQPGVKAYFADLKAGRDPGDAPTGPGVGSATGGPDGASGRASSGTE